MTANKFKDLWKYQLWVRFSNKLVAVEHSRTGTKTYLRKAPPGFQMKMPSGKWVTAPDAVAKFFR